MRDAVAFKLCDGRARIERVLRLSEEQHTVRTRLLDWAVFVVVHDNPQFLMGYCDKDRCQYHHKRAMWGISSDSLETCFELFLAEEASNLIAADKVPPRFGETFSAIDSC